MPPMDVVAAAPAAPSCAPSAHTSRAPVLGAILDRAAQVSPAEAELELDRTAIALLRGASTERRVLGILMAGIVAAALPPWVRAVRLATSVEDRTGLDIVVTCDDGEHCIEIKSSRLGLQKFIRQRASLTRVRPEPRGVLIVLSDTPDRVVRGQVVAALYTLRLERRM